jgi:two-component system, sensor histidine kinase and response regulator
MNYFVRKIGNNQGVRLLMLFMGIFLFCYTGYAHGNNRNIRVGVLAKRGPVKCLKKWKATVDYLSKSIPGYHFSIVPLGFNQIHDAVAKKEVEFILANSSFYVELEMTYGVNRIATLKNKRLNGTYTTFGGVVFTLKRHKRIRSYEDLRGKRFMAVKENSFGGWRMAWREFKEAGINPKQDFRELLFGGTHDAVVYAVMKGKVDAGTVRTETLERMDLEGKIDLKNFHVIHEHGGKKVHLNFLHSTREYPEWPMAKVAHTSMSLAEKVAIKLIEMKPDSPAAVAASCSGWTIPMHYQGVHDCLRYLRIGPYKDYGKIYFSEVFKKYAPILILVILLFMVLLFTFGVYMKMHRDTKASSKVLKKEIVGHKHTAKLLKKAKANADVANSAKGEFLANMSHEIRTPMNAIIGMSYLCLGTKMTVQQRDYIEKVHQSAKLLLQIINDILDFSKIEAGKMKLEKVPFHLDTVLTNLSNMISIKAQEKGLEILFNIDPATPLYLMGDPLRVGQILLNLAGNAVKFTGEGEIVIGISPEEVTEKKVRLLFEVKDTGIGLTKVQTEKLFQSFSQADASTTRKFGGTGLGLSISKYMVEQMGGEIWVESELHSGSEFRFTAEFERVNEDECPVPVESPVNLNNMKVLVVDDVASARQMFRTTLESFSFRVNCVSSGEEAISEIRNAPDSDPYRLILMDNKMPGMDGIEASRLIKSEMTQGQLTTIIMVTAFCKNTMLKDITDAGLDGFLTKPVTPSDLLDAIVNTIGGKGGVIALREGQYEITIKESIKGARILLVEDNKINQAVGRELLTQGGLHVTIANNGKEAVELIQSDSFDAVLMDIQMPIMDGYEATKIIRQNPYLRELPIIATTANAMSGDKEKCIEAGMNDHVAKPIDPEILFATLIHWIPEGNRESTPLLVNGDSPVGKEAQLPITLNGIDITLGIHQTGGRPSFYIEMLNEFVTDHKDDHQKIVNALNENQKDLAVRIAHSLKGVAGGVGAKDLQLHSKAVEATIKSDETGELKSLLENLKGELEFVMVDIIQKLNSEPNNNLHHEEERPISSDELRTLFDKTEELLNEMDPDAETVVKKFALHASSIDISLKESAALMVEQCENMEFFEALEVLKTLENSLAGKLQGFSAENITRGTDTDG